MPSPEPIMLDPERVLTAHRARTRQLLAADSQRVADLLDEVANYEAYTAQLQAEIDRLRTLLPEDSA